MATDGWSIVVVDASVLINFLAVDRIDLLDQNRRILASRYKLHLLSEEELAEKIRRELGERGRKGPEK